MRARSRRSRSLKPGYAVQQELQVHAQSELAGKQRDSNLKLAGGEVSYLSCTVYAGDAFPYAYFFKVK